MDSSCGFLHGHPYDMEVTEMLFDELAEKWIDSIGERVRKTTLCTYRASLSRAMRYLEGKEIGDITGQDLRAMEDGLIQGGGSYQTARLLFNVVRLSLGYAVEEGLLSTNPAERYTPERGSYRQTEKTQAAAPMDVTSLIKSYPFLHPYHMPLELLYGAGLRTGEMLGLTWDHVDLKYGCIHVVRQLVRQDANRYRLMPLRSANLVRDVVIDNELKRKLARWRSDQKMRGILKRNEKDALVCIETDGSPINYGRFTYALRKKGFTPQSLRRAYEENARAVTSLLQEKLSIGEIRLLQEAALSESGRIAYETSRP